jgi:hypothetical protein
MSAAQKTAILAQVGHFYFGAVGQFYVGANNTDARESARALAQIANALKATQSVTRSALGADTPEDLDRPTILEIREYTSEEIARLREEQRARSCESDGIS